MSEYREYARSYRILIPLVALLVALFLVDVALGGAVAHLFGWVIGAVLVLGAWALIIHAARVSHSLSLTADELSIGDESIPRADIVDARPGYDSDTPVLGWPLGRPKAGPGVAVRRADGTGVFVPCRRPDLLLDALGVATGDEIEIRAATAADRSLIPDIDERAEAVFRVAGYDLPRVPYDVDGLGHAKAVFVAGDPPVGYVQVDEVDAAAHIAELAVLPGSMRRGIGGSLLTHACDWARDAGYAEITLITYADVAWNAPFYAKYGFAQADEVTPQLAERRAHETDLGLDDVGPRIVMSRALQADRRASRPA